MEGLTIGRIVWFYGVAKVADGDSGIRPAIVTHVWNDEGMINLHYFLDGSYDRTEVPTARTSVKFGGAHPAVNEWGWPARA